MRTIKLHAIVGNKYNFSGTINPNPSKRYVKPLMIEKSEVIGSELSIEFNTNEKEKLDDFFNSMNHQGGSESYFIEFPDTNKWYESRIIEENDSNQNIVDFLIFKEDEMLVGEFYTI